MYTCTWVPTHVYTQGEAWGRVLVFVATQYRAEHVTRKLRAKGFRAAALHGGLTQDMRHGRLHALHSGSLQVLVATDYIHMYLHTHMNISI